MRKSLLLFIWLTQLHTVSQSQVFKKNYDYFSLSNFNCYERQAGGYITGLEGISKIDYAGNVESFRSIVYPPAYYWKSLVKTNENSYYIDGEVVDTFCFGMQVEILFIAMTDSTLHLRNINAYKLNANCINRPTTMNPTAEGGVISVGEGIIPCGGFACRDKYYALCVDSDLHVKWAKYYTNHFGATQFGKQTPDGGFLLGFNLDTAGAVVAKTDSMGNTIWCKSYIRPKGFIHDCVVNPDGTSIITGFTDSVDIPPSGQYPPNFAPQLFMIKLDTGGNILWAKAFDSDRHWLMWRSSIISTNDGGYAILASVACNPINPILIKTDANGDTLWTRIHGAPNTLYEAISLLQTSDGGYLMGGAAPYNGITSWLYKTDTLGKVPCNMVTQPTYTFPIFPIDSDIVLTSIDGATEVSITLTDTTDAPSAVWDDCDYTGISNSLTENKAKVYPNPTAGKLTLEFKGSLTSDCYFTVYDYTGRIVFQRTLYTEKEKIEVDLSSFGKGLYLVEFTEKEQVSVKKVVVE